MLSKDLQEKIEFAKLKDTIFDNCSEGIRSVYAVKRKPRLEEICPKQTIKNRRTMQKNKIKLRFNRKYKQCEETPVEHVT